MNRLLALAVLLGGLYFAGSSQASQLPKQPWDPWLPPIDWYPKHDVQKTKRIDLTGTLVRIKGGPDPVWAYTYPSGYGVVVDGVTYYLRNADAKSAALMGQRVHVKGVLTVNTFGVGRRSNGKPVQMDARLFTEHYVAVTEIRSAEPEYLSENVTVELRGKLQMHAQVGYPKFDDVALISVNGKSYVLQFSNFAALEKFAAKYDGKTVTIRGSHGSKMHFTVLCQPPIELPSIVVNEIEVFDNGTLQKATLVELTGTVADFDIYPAALVTKNGKSYGLDFGTRDDLLKKFWATHGKTIRVTGVKISSEQTGSIQIRVHVTGVQLLVSEDTVRVTELWQVRGKLLQVHAPYKSMGYVGLWCMIEVNGTCYWLDFGRDMPMQRQGALEKQARSLIGQNVVVIGTYGPRSIGGGPSAIHVESLKSSIYLQSLKPL
jgi:hypothetical protein